MTTEVQNKLVTTENRESVTSLYNFDKKHGTLIDSSDGQFTGGGYHETYDILGKEITYWFHEGNIQGYEYDRIVRQKEIEAKLKAIEKDWFGNLTGKSRNGKAD